MIIVKMKITLSLNHECDNGIAKEQNEKCQILCLAGLRLGSRLAPVSND